MKRKPKTPALKQPEPDPIAKHPDKCPCERCVGLEVCPECKNTKLDIDWCFHCHLMIL